MANTHDFPFGMMDVATLLRLKLRRPSGNGYYVDCPFCGDSRGKMRIDYEKNFWRCNYCSKDGGMLALYAEVHGINKSEAYREICEALKVGATGPECTPVPQIKTPDLLPQSQLATIQQIHQTLSLLLTMLTLTDKHREQLKGRGLSEEQIEKLGYKSTPPSFLCRSYAERLVKQGCIVKGVPGFYQDEDSKWTVKFSSRTAGIIIPARGVDGLMRGAQIRLDTPIRNKNDPPDKQGTKYLWLSSSNKTMGVTSGSPVHFVGNPFARTVYLTEGLLKADVAHFLMDRTFLAIAGANNTSQLDPLFALLKENGTELVIEAQDMDKYANEHVANGTSKIYLIARSHGLSCRRLTWNPNHKGIDDWQLALKQKSRKQKEDRRMNFKTRFLTGLCGMDALKDYVAAWHGASEDGVSLSAHLGLTEEEYAMMAKSETQFEAYLRSLQIKQQFRIYQLAFGEKEKTISFAFCGMDAVRKAGFEQPPAKEYQLVHEGVLLLAKQQTRDFVLEQLFCRYNDDLPKDYHGRSLSVSDVVELYDEETRQYFYCEPFGFTPVQFSPRFAQAMTR